MSEKKHIERTEKTKKSSERQGEYSSVRKWGVVKKIWKKKRNVGKKKGKTMGNGIVQISIIKNRKKIFLRNFNAVSRVMVFFSIFYLFSGAGVP